MSKKEVDSRVDTLTAAISGAETFIAKAKVAKLDLLSRSRFETSKAYAGAKRSSMDLSNLLVAVRHPPYP
jgi:hypothetical protein